MHLTNFFPLFPPKTPKKLSIIDLTLKDGARGTDWIGALGIGIEK